MTLFVCSSVYQLMNALSIALENEEKTSDIILLKSFKDILDIKKMEQLHIFRNIYIWEEKIKILCAESNSRAAYIKQKLMKIPIYLYPQQLIKYLPNKAENYSHIFISYGDFPSQLIYFYFKKKSMADLSLYEDGTYTYECFAAKPSLCRLIYSNVFWGSYFLTDCKNVYIHKIEELKLVGRDDIQVFPIKKNLKEIWEIFQSIAANDNLKSSKIAKRIIMFDQNLEYENILKIQAEIAYHLTENFSPSQICVKLHPNSKSAYYDKRVCINSCKLPFELFINSSITDDSILVSILSTACFNPKWMYDIEPYVILTYKIVHLDSADYFDKQYYEVINRLKKSYRNPEKIFIPECEEDMIEYIKKIL